MTKIGDTQVIIMEYIKGRTIGDFLSENSEQTEGFLNISIDIQRKIHEVPPGPLEPMKEKLKRQIAAAPFLNKRQQSFLIEKMDSMTYEARLCHGDFHPFNLILADDQRITIIDWVDASAGDLRADICRTFLLYSLYSPAIAELYLRLYVEKSGLTKEGILQWIPILAAARLSENVSSEQPERLLDIINQYYLVTPST